jgi:hypothetical protein
MTKKLTVGIVVILVILTLFVGCWKRLKRRLRWGLSWL